MHPGSGGTRARWRAGWTRLGGWARKRPRRGGPGVGAAVATGGTGPDRWSTRRRHGSGAYRHRRRRAGCSSRSMAIGTVACRASQPGLQRRVEVWLAAVRGTRASRGVRTRKGSTWRQAPALMAAVRARSRMGSSSAATTAVHTAATRATNTRASAATPAAEAPDRSTRRRDETIRMSRRLSPWPGEEGSGQLNGQPLWPWSASRTFRHRPRPGGAAGHPTAGRPTTSCAAARAAGGVGTARSAERLS
jgi:hypothetical protein